MQIFINFMHNSKPELMNNSKMIFYGITLWVLTWRWNFDVYQLSNNISRPWNWSFLYYSSSYEQGKYNSMHTTFLECFNACQGRSFIGTNFAHSEKECVISQPWPLLGSRVYGNKLVVIWRPEYSKGMEWNGVHASFVAYL